MLLTCIPWLGALSGGGKGGGGGPLFYVFIKKNIEKMCKKSNNGAEEYHKFWTAYPILSKKKIEKKIVDLAFEYEYF